MSDDSGNSGDSGDSQIQIPPSFIALFIAPGKWKPSEPRDVIAARYELCEDMATMLVEHAQLKQFDLGITEADVLERVHRGLTVAGSNLGAAEAAWVIGRLAELLGWPQPGR